MVGYKCCFYSTYEYKGNMKVTCGMANGQFADSFCLLVWTGTAQTDYFFFNDLFFFFLAYQLDCQEDKVHICFYSYKPEFLNAKKILNNTWAVISLPLIK